MKRPPILESIKRELRQEAYFGCVLCGKPIIEYHHIVPYHEVKCHEKDNLVVLCPEHHHRANCGEIYPELVLKAKQNPFNETQSFVKQDFFLKDFHNLKIKAGSNIYIRTFVILEVDNIPLISIIPDSEGRALLSAKFFNEQNKLMAEIYNNEWRTYTNYNLWDVKYSPGHLKVNSKKNKVLLEFKLVNDLVELRADMFYNFKKIQLNPNKSTFEGISISNSTFIDNRIGISISTRNLY